MDGGRRRQFRGRSNECVVWEIVDAVEDKTVIFEDGLIALDSRPSIWGFDL